MIPQSNTEQVRVLLDLSGGRWTLPVLDSLQPGPMRFSTIRRALSGIAQKQLTHTLRQLERDGFVLRTAYPTIPPRVEYQLTDLGRDLASRLASIGQLAIERGDEIETARQRFDRTSVANHSPV